MNDLELQQTLSRLDANVALLVEQQQKQQELLDTLLLPLSKEVLKSLTGTFGELEQKGYFAFGKELLGVLDAVVTHYKPEDVRALAGAITTILDSVRAVTQPEVIRLAADAAEVVQGAEQVQPVGLMGVMRATSDADIGRSLAVLLEVLRRTGKGLSAIEAKDRLMTTKKAKVDALLAPKRGGAKKALGVERRPVAVRAMPAAAHAGASCAVPNKPQATAQVVDGVGYGADGHLTDASQWTKALGEAIAKGQGVALDEPRWGVILKARTDFEATQASPNIRRLTQVTGLATKDLYTLFPKAPARTIAKIAGLPKPAGCL